MLYKQFLCGLWLGCFGLVEMSQSAEPKLTPLAESSTQAPSTKVKRAEMDPFADAQAILEKERQFHFKESSKSPESSLNTEKTKGRPLEK